MQEQLVKLTIEDLVLQLKKPKIKTNSKGLYKFVLRFCCQNKQMRNTNVYLLQKINDAVQLL